MRDPFLRMLALAFAVFLLTSMTPEAAEAISNDEVSLSSMVAVSLVDDNGTGAENAADYVKGLVALYAANALPSEVSFPLANTNTDSVRALEGFRVNVVISWLDPLTLDTSIEGPRFGANADYTAYFGDGWEEADGLASSFKGSDNSGWVWINHEHVSGSLPTLSSAPQGQNMTLAKFLGEETVLALDVTSDAWTQADIDTYIGHYKKQLGGSWFRIVQDPSSGEWTPERSAANQRYDGTSNTLTSVTGFELKTADQSDFTGEILPGSVVSGILGNCSGGQTPWGTIISAEENVHYYYGDVEASWTILNQFLPGAGFDAGSTINPVLEASRISLLGRSSDPNQHHGRDGYGFLTEMQPGAAPSDYYESVNIGGDGGGHRKIGSMGRARWENAGFHVGPNWELVDGQPLVIYAANDRLGGRIYKLVTNGIYVEGMTQEEVRALLDEGTVYVSHLEDLDYESGLTIGGVIPTETAPGHGRWIKMSIDSQDIAPNAEILGPGTTVGEALQDSMWNNIGAFTSDNDVLLALFTAANKIGVAELNRPEDVEWNPSDPSGTPRLYVAFTQHNSYVALNENGIVYDLVAHAEYSPQRKDRTGSIFAIEESDPAHPAASLNFSYFAVWVGSEGADLFNVSNPDNLMIDADGGLWFATDGNFGTNATAEGLYYLDLDPAHREGAEGVVKPTWGKAFRVVASPSESEMTGPAFSSRMSTIFFNFQPQDETQYGSWFN